jgi:hypothetical protein
MQHSNAIEGPVGQLPPELLKPPLRRVELRGVRREHDEAHVLRMVDLLGAVAGGAVQHDEQVVLGVGLRELLEEDLQRDPSSIPGRYTQKLSPVAGSTAAYR